MEKGGKGRGRASRRDVGAQGTQNLLGLSTDLIGFLAEDWSRGKHNES